MDAMAYMFSVAREDSSNVLEFKPECSIQEDLMSLSSKFPLIPGSQRSITFCTTTLSQQLREMPPDADFDLTDPCSPPPRYNVLHDPHLKEYFQNAAMRRRLVEKGFITSSGFVKCTLLEFNMFRQWIRKLKLDRIHQERRRERQLEKQLWKERLAREQLLRDEELYSIVREREQKARELKERGAKRREADRRKYLKLQEIDLKRREKFEENVRRKKDVNESVREKDLATKQVEKVIEEEKVKKIKIRLLVKRSSEDKQRESMLLKRRQTIIEEKEQKLKENWKRRCSLSLARQEEKRKQEENERQEHERNVVRRTSIVAQQRRKSRVHHDMCLQRRRSTLEKQHQEAVNFLEKMREKKMRDLERWKQKHARMRERHLLQERRLSLQTEANDRGNKHRRRTRLSSVWDLQSSLRREFGIEDNVVYSGVVFAGTKTKHEPRQSVQLEAVSEEGTCGATEEADKFEKMWSRLEAEFALRERVHYVVFGIISNAEEVLNRQERQKTYRQIPNYVQGIVNAAQEILDNEQAGDGDVRSKVRKYILQVIDDASLVVDNSGLLLSSDTEIRQRAQEVVTNAVNKAREDVSFRGSAKDVVAAAISNATQKAAQEISEVLSKCAKDVVAVAIVSATRYKKDTCDVIAARSLAVDAANAAKGSLERLYGVKFDVVEGEQVGASLDKCAKVVAAAAIISATRSLERVIGVEDCDLIAARSLAADAVTAAKASVKSLYGAKVETENDDQDYSVAISKCLVKSAKEIAQAVVSPATRLLEKSTGKDDAEDLTAQWLATDAIRAARASLEKLYGIKVEEKDPNEQTAKEIAAAAVMTAAKSLENHSLRNDRDVVVAALGLASNAVDSAKASLDWFYNTKVAPEAKIEGKAHKMFLDLDEVAKDIAEVAVNSATRSLERITEKNEWDLISTTRDLVSDVLNSAKVSLERLYGIKIEPEEELILTAQKPSESSLEYSICSASHSLESIKGHEEEVWIAAQSLARNALKSATASLERLHSIADKMENNIKNSALDISKTLMDSSGNLLQKLEKEGLSIAARDLACNAIVSVAKSFSKLHEDETSLQDIAGTDANLLNAAAKVSTVSARASLGELFDRGFIGGLELEEATGYLATHAMLSAESLLDTLQDDTAAVNLDLEICKAANQLASHAVVSAEGSVTRLAVEHHRTSIDHAPNPGTMFWKVTTYVEGLINGALRHAGAEGYYVDINDDSEEYQVLTHDQAHLADTEYGVHVDDIYQREILELRASRIVNDVVQNAMDIVKTLTANESFFSGQSLADGRPRNAKFTRRRRSSVHFNDNSNFRPRRDSYVPRETDFLSTSGRPGTPRFRKGRAHSLASQEIQELEKELEIPSETDLTTTNAFGSGLVQRRSSDPGPEFHSEDVASTQPERPASESKIEQGTSLDEKPSLYDIIKRREELASCEISPCESYVVLPQLNPSERSLIAARVESYEVLWKQKKTTPSVTSLPSLSPKGSFVASDVVEQVHSRKETKGRSVPSSSRLPDISSSTSKIYNASLSASSLKGTSGHPRRTSSQHLKKSPKASPRTSRESVKLSSKSSTDKCLQSPRASVGKVAVTSRTSLRKKEDGSRRNSSENATVVTPKASVKDVLHSQRATNAKVIVSPGSSLAKASLSPRTSTENPALSKGTSSQNQIKSSPQSSKLFARASTEKTTSSSGASLEKGPATPRGSLERAALTPRESTGKVVLSPRVSNRKVASSPSASRERAVLSSSTSKGNVTSPRMSTGNAALSPRVSKGKVTQSPRGSTENAVLSPRVSKGKVTQFPRDSAKNVALSPRVSKGKVMQSPRASVEKIALSSHVSKENVLVSPVSTEKIPPSSRSTEIVQSGASVLKDDSASSSNVAEQTAPLLRISLHKVTPSKTPSDDADSTLVKTSKTMARTPSDQSAKSLDSHDAMTKTEPTEKSKTPLKTSSHSGEKLAPDLASSAQNLGRAVELDGGSSSVVRTPLKPDASQLQKVGSERDRPDVNKDERDGESIETKEVAINQSLKGTVHSLERIILEKRLTPEGAEADTRPASSADIAASRKYTDPVGTQRTFTAQLDTSKSAKSSLTKAVPSISESPRSSREKMVLKASDVEEEVFTSRKKPEGEDESELQGVASSTGSASSKKEGEKKGSVSKISDGLAKERQVQRPSTNKKQANDFNGYPTYRKVSVSRSIHDTVDDMVQRMLNTADEPGVEASRPTGSGSCEDMKRDSVDVSRRFGRERRLPTGKISGTVLETVDFMVQSVSSSDERRPRQFSGGVPRTASSMDKFPRGTTSGQDLSCVYGVSPSPPTGPQSKLPSPKRSRIRSTCSQDSMGVRATQSDSSIVSSSSDKAADLRPKVSGAWLDDVIVAGGDASVRSQSPKRPSSSPTSSQHRRSLVRLSVKNSLDRVCLEADGHVGKVN